ncbi:MAG: glycogen operon protein GlgX homolog [Gammaproteobacteria bacterium]|nr:MAG: glycogen operon protein GlgX homolog [Gammaproteobacteria bacterium]
MSELRFPPGWRPGANPVAGGVEFGVFSLHAEAIELCLFGPDGRQPERRVPMQALGEGFWFARVPDIGPGEHYGLRVHGPWAPQEGHRFNPNKLMLDPCARAVTGGIEWCPAVYPYDPDDPARPDARDNAPFVPRSRVVADPRPATEPPRPAVPLADTIVYELHVKGFTQRHPGVPEADRGRYRGLIAPAVLEHFRRLGVTTLELMPCAVRLTPEWLQRKGLSNYWGYDPIAFWAPDPRFAREDALREFREMVDGLHQAGLEVIVDVVFNHSGEGDAMGPALSLRGVDNATYYRLDPADRARYLDFTGCGNTLDFGHPWVRAWALAALRHWAEVLGVDGFRFDLAVSVGRGETAFEPDGPFFRALAADPVLSRCKLIAEPWDLGPDGYRLGGFPKPWSEWNDRYRDGLRRYWRGDPGMVPELARRLSGSADVFAPSGRDAGASINFITAHDGFTLHDLVSYSHKHNEANGEDNRDGHHENHSANYGVEGETDDPAVRAVRARQQRNFLASLFCSLGVPMLLAGDELDRSQGGNNNAWCQDNALAWLDWSPKPEAEALFAFTCEVIGLRKRYAALRRLAFLEGRLLPELGCRDVEWLRPDGRPMRRADWDRAEARFLGMQLADPSGRGEHVLLACNAGERPQRMTVPAAPGGAAWRVLLDTALWPERGAPPLAPGATRTLEGRSLLLAVCEREA